MWGASVTLLSPIAGRGRWLESYRDWPLTETPSNSLHEHRPAVTSGQEVGQTWDASRVCDAGISSDPRPQEAGWVLIVLVEQVVDAGKRLQVRVDLVVCRDIDHRVARRVQVSSEAVATNVLPVANMHKRCRQGERVDRIPKGLQTPFVLRPSQ